MYFNARAAAGKPGAGGLRGRRGGSTLRPMSYRVIEFETTPNPNAMMARVDRPICEVTRSYFNATAAQRAGDALAEALFAVPGVSGVMMLRDFVTINKTPDAAWPGLKKRIKRVLEEGTKAPSDDRTKE
jgi:Scaffold protein Nfu/NifU N terminal